MTKNNIIQTGGETSIFTPIINAISYMNSHVMYLNNSKFFAGVIMILLNVGSKFISIQFSKSTEEYMKYTVSKQLLVFSMAWMGTRDIYTALGLTAVFTILSEHLFNEDSNLCIVPHNYRVLKNLMDTNDNGVVSETELASAIAVLEKAKREKQHLLQKQAFAKFDFEKYNYDK
uniref:EF-hand domain-containing protein n=1 Tax=viral metagenome TaxID=1070528 RepID=A0A6C0ERY9_9ZZZZ